MGNLSVLHLSPFPFLPIYMPCMPSCMFLCSHDSCGEDGDVRFFDLRDEPGRGGGCRMAVKAGIEPGQGRGIVSEFSAWAGAGHCE